MDIWYFMKWNENLANPTKDNIELIKVLFGVHF